MECLTGGLAGRCFSGLAENGNEGWRECVEWMELMLEKRMKNATEDGDKKKWEEIAALSEQMRCLAARITELTMEAGEAEKGHGEVHSGAYVRVTCRDQCFGRVARVAEMRAQKDRFWYLDLLPTATRKAERIWKKEKHLELIYPEEEEVNSVEK